MTTRNVLLALMVLLQTAPVTQQGRDRNYAQVASLYNQVGILKGQIIEVNNPELGRTPASGQYILFQRTSCERCLIGVRADIEGRYTLFLGAGQYRLLPLYEPQGEVDLVRSGQIRRVTVRQAPSTTEFNIELEVPKRQ